mmetsp:Transcript_35738/g.60908  ORF Transcript_35738/g.60908 Transcript_35738/m.60908 type:complete len:80 (-) Transcript_35738:207-446(-)
MTGPKYPARQQQQHRAQKGLALLERFPPPIASGQALFTTLPLPPEISPMSRFDSSYRDAKLSNNPGNTISPSPSMLHPP